MNTEQAIIIARKHVGNGAAMDSSARLCLSDAIASMERGDLQAAHMWALKSLAHSVGIFHGDYQRVFNSPIGKDQPRTNMSIDDGAYGYAR